MHRVLDCSLALAWGLPDEGSKRADRLLAEVAAEDLLLVPALWWYELANALTVAHRRGRLRESNLARLLELYDTLPIRTDADLTVDAVRRFIALAREHDLSAYDAAYLELAQRHGARLATLDHRLLRAAGRAGIQVEAL